MRIYLLSFLLFFISCDTVSFVTPHYKEISKTFTIWPDFKNGTFLLYEINAPSDVKIELYNEITKDFKNILGDRFTDIDHTQELVELGVTRFTKEKLQEIKKQSGVDYILIINATESAEEYYTHITPTLDPFKEGYYNKKTSSKKETFTDFIIYDLNHQKKIFYHTMIAELENTEVKMVNIQTPSKKMILKSYRKIFKRLKKKSKQ